MGRPNPTYVVHFTHIDHLPGIIQYGLVADTEAQASGLLTQEVGNRGVKTQRRARVVPVPPGGYVGDYVPFYFAPRSPTLNAIHHGRVPEYQDGIDPLIYLVTTVERLAELDLRMVFTDRNAALIASMVTFSASIPDLDMLVDWNLMRATMWNNTLEDPDRRDRRMPNVSSTSGCHGKPSLMSSPVLRSAPARPVDN